MARRPGAAGSSMRFIYLRYNTGRGSCQTESATQPKSFTWTYTSDGATDEGAGDNWARLSLLESRPRTTFATSPAIDVLLPNNGSPDGLFEVTGQVTGGSLPIFVRVTLEPRRNTTSLTVSNPIASDPELKFPVHTQDLIYLEGLQSATAGSDGTFRLGLSFYKDNGDALLDDTGNPLKVLLPAVTPALTPERYSGVVRVPEREGICYAKLEELVENHTTGTWTTGNYRVHTPQYLGAPLDSNEGFIPGFSILP